MSKSPKHVAQSTSQNFKKLPQIYKSALNIVILVLIFGVGVGVGNGKITFGADALYRQSVQNNDLPKNLDFSGIDEIYGDLKEGYDGQLDIQKLQDGLKQGLVKAAGDPYTEYLNAEATNEFNEQLSGTFEGIGAELGKQEQSIVIIAPIAGFPAEKAGLRAGDIIAEADGASLYDVSITEAVNKIRGPKDTVVKLKIVRDSEPLDFDITRDTISLPSVTSEMNGTVGIIKLSRFGEDTVELTRNAANDLKGKGATGIVLDMRGNPGGLLDAAVGVSSLWLENGKTVLQEKRDGKVIKTFKASGSPVLRGMKTVVLVDEGSASASEIVAGALRDNEVATITGAKSYGKGSVQEIRQLRGGGALKVTIARWFTPNGRNIDKEGIEPDNKVELTRDDFNAKRDPQKDAALESLR